MNRNYGLGGTRSSCRTTSCQPGPAARYVRGFRRGPRFHAKMAARRTALPIYRTGQVGVMTLITRQCFAIPTSSPARPRDRAIDGERVRRGPGRTSEREADERSDLICDRKTPCPLPPPHPLLLPAAVNPPRDVESTSCNTLLPPPPPPPPALLALLAKAPFLPARLLFVVVVSLVFRLLLLVSLLAR